METRPVRTSGSPVAIRASSSSYCSLNTPFLGQRGALQAYKLTIKVSLFGSLRTVFSASTEPRDGSSSSRPFRTTSRSPSELQYSRRYSLSKWAALQEAHSRVHRVTGLYLKNHRSNPLPSSDKKLELVEKIENHHKSIR